METTLVSISRWMDKEDVVHTHNECYSAIKKNEILPFAAMWIDLEDIMPSDMSEKHKYCISLICEILKIELTGEYNKKRSRLIDTKNKQVVTSGKGGGGTI